MKAVGSVRGVPSLAEVVEVYRHTPVLEGIAGVRVLAPPTVQDLAGEVGHRYGEEKDESLVAGVRLWDCPPPVSRRQRTDRLGHAGAR